MSHDVCWRPNFIFLKYKLVAKELNDSPIKFPWRLNLRFQDGVFWNLPNVILFSLQWYAWLYYLDVQII